MSQPADRNLLLGVLALQMGLVDRDGLLAAMSQSAGLALPVLLRRVRGACRLGWDVSAVFRLDISPRLVYICIFYGAVPPACPKVVGRPRRRRSLFDN